MEVVSLKSCMSVIPQLKINYLTYFLLKNIPIKIVKFMLNMNQKALGESF